jgi:hypothetical protein
MSKTNTDKPLVNIICKRISYYIHAGMLSDEDLVQIIEHTGDYLNLKTRSNYAKEYGISYNGAKKFRQNVNLFGAKFIIDNS